MKVNLPNPNIHIKSSEKCYDGSFLIECFFKEIYAWILEKDLSFEKEARIYAFLMMKWNRKKTVFNLI
jgi:hypothetical protein